MAKRRFSSAIEIDPRFALAHVGMADCYGVEVSWGYSSESEVVQKEKQFALNALEIDANLAEAHTAYAMVLGINEWRWVEAELEFKRAIDLNPSYATAHHWYSFSVLRFARRIEEEMREVEKALELDPLASVMYLNKGQSLYYQERYDEAIESFKKALAVDPGFLRAYLFQAGSLLMSGRHAEAIRLNEEYLPKLGMSVNQQKLNWLETYALTGRVAEAQKLLADLKSAPEGSVSAAEYAGAYLALGEGDKMFELLESAVAQRSSYVPFLLIDPLMKPFRSDLRYQKLKGKVGI